MSYSNFEKDFKEQSIALNFSRYKIALLAILYLGLILISYLSKKLGYPIINMGAYIIMNSFLAYLLFYFKVVKKIEGEKASFKRVFYNINLRKIDFKEKDLDLVKSLCDKYDIVYEKQIAEMLVHYRSKRTSTSIISICLTIVSIAISITPLFVSDKGFTGEYIMTIVLTVFLFVAVICYIVYYFYDMYVRAATKNELYKNLEEYLSEIYLHEVCFDNIVRKEKS